MSSGTYTTAPATLASLHEAGQRKFGDYRQAYTDRVDDQGQPLDVAVLRHPLRLSSEQRKSLTDTPARIDAVQADPPEVAAARQVLADAETARDETVERRDNLADESTSRLVRTHETRVEEAEQAVADARTALEAAIVAHVDEDAQLAAVCDVVRDMIRLAVADQSHADGLIAALGDDLGVHLAIVEAYMGKGQVGEAQPSES